MGTPECFDTVIVGGGIAGLSASIYLGRARRSVLVVDDGKSMARWEPEVENFLGFPEGIGGPELLRKGREQSERYGAGFLDDRIRKVQADPAKRQFLLVGDRGKFRARRVLLATGIDHLPPEIPGVSECLGHSMFFCKDCDATRTEGKRVGILGWNEDAVDYALAMLVHCPCVFIFRDEKAARWSERHDDWLNEYRIPVFPEKITWVHHRDGQLFALDLADRGSVELDALFTTRGDTYHNRLARQTGANTGPEGEILVDASMETSVKGLYAAGCATPANCQMIIAAGNGATAAQAINRSLFEESLASHSLLSLRRDQFDASETRPPVHSTI